MSQPVATSTNKKRPTVIGGKAVIPGASAILGMEDVEDILEEILADAAWLKSRKNTVLPQLLAGKAILMIYEKNSTRTRVSFEVGVQRLGGIAVNIDSQTSQMGRGESIEDTAQVLSRYGHALVFRSRSHESLEALARYATVPVVNALTDIEHPCQILADWLTLREHLGSTKGKVFTYVGDGNNMLHSYLLGAPMLGMDIQYACPKGYDPAPDILERAKALAEKHGTKIRGFREPAAALKGAHAVATDTWVSMGDEAETLQREKAFKGYTLTDEMMEAHAEKGAIFLHCLPGHWGQEATYELAHGAKSVIFDEAENRMWAQMALLLKILKIELVDNPKNAW